MMKTGNTFNDEYKVVYVDLDNTYKMKPSRILSLFQHLATLHSNYAGYPVKTLSSEMGIGWILLFWHIKIDRLPDEEEKLTLHTWSEMFRKIQANRDFVMEDENGKEIVYASSRWALMDLNKRRPYRMTKEFYEKYLLENSREVAEEKYEKIKAPENADYVERVFRVYRRDTDTNSHVNNVIYLDWALDDIPDEIYENWNIVDIKVAYKKECMKNFIVRSRCYTVKKSEPGSDTFVGEKQDKENSSESTGVEIVSPETMGAEEVSQPECSEHFKTDTEFEDCSEIEFISIFSKEDDDKVEYCQVVTTWKK